jgi:hypothetical protein
MSDCSITHPIARDPCSGTAPSTRGLKSCATLGIQRGHACGARSPSCYVERACNDGRNVPGDFLVCTDATPGRCMTRSSKQYKDDIHYLSATELRELAHQIQALPLARFRYTDQVGGDPRVGFLTEDAHDAPFVTNDGRAVDLYALLASSIAAIQQQDARIRALEREVSRCRATP